MMGLLTAVPRLVASALTKLTPKQTDAVFWIWWYGISRGYAFENITFIAQQMVLETGWGGSELLESNNNAYGMSCTNSVYSTQVGCTQLQDGNTNGVYSSVQKSVKDRFLWDEKRFTEPFKFRKDPNYPKVVAERYFPDNPAVYRATIGSIDVSPLWTALTVFCVFVPLELLAVMKVVKL